MKKTAIVTAVALVGLASIAQAATPKDDTWYAGGKLAWSRFHDTSWYSSSLNNDGPTHKDQMGIGAFGGYQKNSYISFEMGYDWLGRMPYKGDNVNGSFKAQGIQLTAKLDYPVTDDLDVYTRIGSMLWHADSRNSKIFGDNHDTGASAVLAGGVEWGINSDVAARLEYQWVNNIGDGNTIGTRPDNGILSAGISYRFGKDKQEITSVASSTLSPEVETKHVTLKSDILFDFDRSSIKPEGQQTLDQLYNKLISLDPKDSSIIILGFTDRIGSETYNQSLSEKRAQSVVDYLTSRGPSSLKISASGMGESNPVTGNICDNIKNSTALIDCLAPDRRVEIKVEGVRDTVTQPTT